MSRPFLYVLLFVSIVFNIILLSRQRPSTGVKVIGVLDGDTVVVEGKTRIRLRYVDAPEQGMCGSVQATQELERLALGKKIRVEENIPDQYGRGMALIYDGTILINKEMVANGWVRYHSDRTEKTAEIKLASQIAKQEKKGIFGNCHSTTNIKQPSCVIKGNIDKNTYTNNKKYYLPGCAQYAYAIVEEDIGEQWFCTEKEARDMGFIKAETCTQ